MHNSIRSTAALATGLIVAGLVAGCAAPMAPMSGSTSGYGNPAPSQAGSQYGVQYGQVQSIEVVRSEQQAPGATGAVLGAVIGGVLGNQVGSGSGRAAATAGGVIGGAMIGNEIEKRRQPAAGEVVRVLIRFDNGSTRYFDYAQSVDLRVGDRVRVENDRVSRY